MSAFSELLRRQRALYKAGSAERHVIFLVDLEVACDSESNAGVSGPGAWQAGECENFMRLDASGTSGEEALRNLVKAKEAAGAAQQRT